MKKAAFAAFSHLFHDGHLINQVPRTGKFVDDEEHVSDVNRYVAADVGVVDEVAHCAFPTAVEIEAQKLSVSVQNRAA